MSVRCYAPCAAVVLLIAVTAVAAADESENLLANGMFVPGDDKALPGEWIIPESQHHVALDQTDCPPDASRSLRIDIQALQASWGEVLQRLCGLEPQTTYRFSAMIRSTAPRLGVLQVKLYKNRKEQKRLTSERSSTQWQRIAIEFSSEDADKIELLLRFVADKPEAANETVWFADAQLVVVPPPELTAVEAVGTFCSLGVTAHYQGGANASHACQLRYRVVGEKQWREGMDLVLYPPERQFRGSLLSLAPDRNYEIACRLVDVATGVSQPPQVTTCHTWSEQTPIGEVRHLPTKTNDPLVIAARGEPDAWIVYRPADAGTATIDAGDSEDYAVQFDGAAYVIFENIVVRGGRKDAVRVSHSQHVRIRRCDIADWSDPGTHNEEIENGLYVDAAGRVINYRAGVRVAEGSSQVVVEDNYIHHPRGTANSWKYGHPAGPQGVILDRTRGNNVVRNNDIVGSEQHWWNDGIESIRNSDPDGGPYHDTDIYGNVLTFQNDDGIELDGGQINVRCFGNWIDKALCGISCAPNRRGPSYVYRNLIVLTGDEHFQTGAGFKMGGDRYPDPGLSILLHNTVYSHRAGLTAGHYGSGPTPIRSRNNVFAGPYGRAGGNFYKLSSGADFAYDLVPPGNVVADSPWTIESGIVARPKFRDVAAGDFRLAEGSPGIDAGQRLATVNDTFTSEGPDVGVFERGRDSSSIFPTRSNGIWALPLRSTVDFVSDNPTTALIQLSVPMTAGSRWTAHPNSPWLKCTPDSGDAHGQPQAIRVSLADVDPAVRLYRGAVTFRTDTGLNRTVMVVFRVMPQPYVAMPFEAESGVIVGELRQVEDVAASGGLYLDTLEGAKGSVSFVFDAPHADTYYVTGRTCVPGPAGDAGVRDSFEISIDGGKLLRWDLVREAPDEWIWCLAAPERTPPHAFDLSAGEHTVTIHSRERLARMDRVVVTNAPYAEPSP